MGKQAIPALILEARNLTKKFGGLLANDHVDINLKEGEILGLIGANGAGKTTLFHMVSGACKPTSGEVFLWGKPIHNLSPHEICRMGLARTFQIVQPFSSLTVLENVMVGALLREKRPEKAMQDSLQVLETVGLYYKKDMKGAALSLPELKRMEVARALATRPSVLLLDEAMAGLNPSEIGEVIELVRQIRSNGVSIIIIEHVMKAIMSLSDRIYVLNQGRLIAEGTPGEISNNEAVKASYFGEKKYVEAR